MIPGFAHRSLTAFFTLKTLGTDPKVISSIASIPEDQIFLPVQRHTDTVLVLEGGVQPEIADAVVTAEKNILIGVQTADCVPVLLFDKERGIVGAVHAGWRGTAKGIVKKTMRIMREKFHSSPKDIYAAVGPSIRWNCYCVGPEVLVSVSQATGPGNYYRRNGSGTFFLDLSSATIIQMISEGIPDGNIWLSDACTYCNPEKYFSYRYSKSYKGNQGGFIGIV